MVHQEQKIFEKLRSKNTVQVEDLLLLAKVGDAATADELQKVCAQRKWEDIDQTKNSSKVPLKTWTLVVSSYLKDGLQGLKLLVGEKTARARNNLNKFVIALLEDLHDIDSIRGVFQIYDPVLSNPKDDLNVAMQIASTFNMLLSFPPKVGIDDSDAKKIREFLHKMVVLVSKDSEKSVVYLALREVGNSDSIDLIESQNRLSDNWVGLEKRVISKIKNNNYFS